MLKSWVFLTKSLQNEKIERKNSKIQICQKVSIVKDDMKSGVRYIINGHLQIFNVGHGGGGRTVRQKI